MKTNQKYIWDYDINNLDLSDPASAKWYLTRKINFGDWQSVNHRLLQKYLPQLDIDPTLKKMLQKYYANQRTKNRT